MKNCAQLIPLHNRIFPFPRCGNLRTLLAEQSLQTQAIFVRKSQSGYHRDPYAIYTNQSICKSKSGFGSGLYNKSLHENWWYYEQQFKII